MTRRPEHASRCVQLVRVGQPAGGTEERGVEAGSSCPEADRAPTCSVRCMLASWTRSSALAGPFTRQHPPVDKRSSTDTGPAYREGRRRSGGSGATSRFRIDHFGLADGLFALQQRPSTQSRTRPDRPAGPAYPPCVGSSRSASGSRRRTRPRGALQQGRGPREHARHDQVVGIELDDVLGGDVREAPVDDGMCPRLRSLRSTVTRPSRPRAAWRRRLVRGVVVDDEHAQLDVRLAEHASRRVVR